MVESNSESPSLAAGRGRWSERGVPHRGWHCVDIEDRGIANQLCDMCESQLVRYVHHMQQDDYADVLSCVCVCAGNMEGDLQRAYMRERRAKSRSAKRKLWLLRNWRVSQKGNEWIKADGYRITVFPRGGRWSACVSDIVTDSTFSPRGRTQALRPRSCRHSIW